MLGRTYDREICSAARALEIAGERWSLLILRNAAFAGMTRFTEFQGSLGIAPNILAARLEHFLKEGIMTASPGASPYAEYRLTDKGQDFKRVIIALTDWGDRWAAPDGPPIVYEHGKCGGHVTLDLECDSCGQSPSVSEVVARKTEAMARGRERLLSAPPTAKPRR
jgi:DNA-binding HxlR family transcriptional regulator